MTKLSRRHKIRLSAQPLPPSPVSKLSLFLSLPVCCRSSLLRGGGARSQIIPPRKAWPSINHSLLPDMHCRPASSCLDALISMF